MEEVTIKREFIDQSIFRLKESELRIELCLEHLTEQELWKRPNEASNSVGNLIVHLCGNVTQYIISALGGAPDQRERDLEFEIKEGLSKEEVLEKLSYTINSAIDVINQLGTDQLENIRSVQGFDLSGIGIILHVVEHFSYHTGQIAFWTKLLKDRDLGFYSDVDLNVKNE